MNLKALLFALGYLLFAASASAQWDTTTYSLKGGWNSIYLHGDATHATPDDLFASNPEVIEIWRWNPNPNQVQFTTSSLSPSAGTSEWSVWRRGKPGESTLADLVGQTGYLVRCKGTATAVSTITGDAVTSITVTESGRGYTVVPTVTIPAPPGGVAATATATILGGEITGINITSGGSGYTGAPAVTIAPPSTNMSFPVEIIQKPLPPRSTWVRSGSNLMGFPSFKNGASYPSFSSYFATFPTATAANTKIYKYVGGDLGPNNPVQIFSPTMDKVDRNQAYWFEAEVVGNFYAPVDISLSNAEGLAFARTGTTVSVRVRNRTSAGMTVTLSPVNSIPAPTGQDGVTGPVPLTKRTYNTISGLWDETLIAAAYTEVIPAQTTIELSFGINRAAMTGASDSLYASLLSLKDNTNLFEIELPVSARKESLAGLWIGDATIGSVSSQVASSPTAKATVVDGVLTGIEVTSRGVGYTTAPTVTIEPPFSAVQALATATVTGGGTVSSVSVVAPGTAYLTAPNVTVAAPPAGVQATATAVVTDGGVGSVTVTEAGVGYFSGATVTVGAPPSGTQATATAVLSGDGVASITVNTSGDSYATVPEVLVAPPGIQTQALAALTDGTVSSITPTIQGSGYASPPTVTIAPPNAPASATATLSGTGVFSATVDDPGYGYTTAPPVVIAAPGIQGTATATLSGGGVGSIAVNNAGTGYLVAPKVTVSAPTSGIAATAVATVSGGVITGVVVTLPGSNYSSPPTVTIAAPGTAATATATLTGGTVSSITITDPGSGYASAPVITVSAPPPGSVATADAVLTGGAVTSFTITDPGSGYITVPMVTVEAAGTTATAVATVSGQSITGITVTDPGTGYTSAPVVTIPAPTRAATVIANLSGGTITSISVTDPGNGYASAPSVTISAPQTGTTATVTAEVSGGAVTGFTVTDPGAGYPSSPLVTIDGPSPGAVASAILDGDAVGSVSVTAPGSGYFTVPSVTVGQSPAGTAATATVTATISGGAVSGIVITNPGSGYVTAPTITIAAPPPGSQAQATATLSGGAVSEIALTQAGSGYVTPPKITFSAPPAVPSTPTARKLPLRMILHIDDNGTARVLSQVFLGKLATAPHDYGLCTRQSGLKADELATASRIVAVHLPPERVLASGSGSAGLGQTLVRSVSIPFDDNTNPFVHKFHPDHDNKDARGVPRNAGVESFNITRTMTFQFTTSPPYGSAATGWGSTTIGGFYTEILSGLHKNSLTTSGTFELRRASEIGDITIN